MRSHVIVCVWLFSVICRAQVSVVVPGTSQISLAGQPPGAKNVNGDSTPLNAPVEVLLPVVAGEAFQIVATGAVGIASSNYEPTVSPDGAAEDFTDDPYGVSRIDGPGGVLIGVFLGNSVDVTAKPPSTNFMGASASRELLYPMLQQPFLVGSGKTAAGRWRTIVAPAGAKRLFFGVLSLVVKRNTGSFNAVVSITAIPELPGNPLRIYGDSQISLAGQSAGASNVNHDAVPLNAPAQVALDLKPGQTLRIIGIGAIGTIHSNFQPILPPDGGEGDFTDSPFGVSRIVGPSGALIGVFLGARADGPKPPNVDYTSSTAQDLPTVSPLLQQPFFIGTGSRVSGELKNFVVPQGATRLFLGVLSLSTRRNTGSFIATVSPDDPSVPQFTLDGVRNAAGFGSAVIAPNMIISLFGTGLAQTSAAAVSTPLPDALAGTRIWFDLEPAPLFYASADQMNAQVPTDLNATSVQLVVTKAGVPGLPITVPLAPYSPGIFTQATGDPVIVNNTTGKLVSAHEAAKPGDILIVFATGLGPVSVPVAAGTPAPTNPLATATAPVTARLGKLVITPMYAGLAPRFVGVFQVNVRIPSGAPSGAAAFTLEVAGTSSNTVAVAIQDP